WETKIGDRSFTLNEDTTLAFKYFNNEPPAGQIVEAKVVFSVDVGAYETMGIFSVDREDTVQVRGGFNGWGRDALPDQSNLVLLRVPGTTVYYQGITLTKFVGSTDEYKYYIKLSQTSRDLFLAQNPYFFDDMQYENPADWGGGNRMFTFEGDPDTPQQLPLEYYAGVPPLGLIPDGDTVSITFTVDMRPGILAATPLFDPAADSVWWVPKDEWVAHVLGYLRPGAGEEKRPTLKMTPTAANDSIYTITFDYIGPIPYTMVYVYEFGSEVNGYIQEGGGFAAGRFRCRYIQPELIGPVVWPRNYTVPTDLVQKEAPLVQEEPPELEVVGIADEQLVPRGFSVSQNYPNPFNPTTEIRFTLPKADDVSFTVYNLLGQRVVTYSRYFPAPGTYAFRWHGLNQAGRSVPSGIYFYEVKTSEYRVTRKMTLLK
ncbi:MAG: T9SS type A sorting domain-containing protein, partial [Candidatus Neomarinimicrobiota bacterium]